MSCAQQKEPFPQGALRDGETMTARLLRDVRRRCVADVALTEEVAVKLCAMLHPRPGNKLWALKSRLVVPTGPAKRSTPATTRHRQAED